MDKLPIIIYHGGCDDGFGAAYAAWKRFGEDAIYHPGVYQQDPPDVKGRDVFLLDFSYKRPVIEKMLETANSITIIDHHKTAQDDIEPMTDEGLIDGVFDMDQSGCVMAWRWFCPGTPVPALFQHIQDRDLWRFKLCHTDTVIMALRSYPQDFDTWGSFLFDAQRLREEGKHINRFYQKKVEEVKRIAYKAFIGDYEVPVVSCPWFLASDVAGELAEGAPFAAAYWDHPEGRTYSLRSRGDFDVSEIAKKYGGGGHKNAAGFKISNIPSVTLFGYES